MSDRTRLKNLLKKAKTALDNINLKYRQTQDKLSASDTKLREAISKNDQLTKTLEIIQEQRNGISNASQVKNLLCRIKVA